MFEKKKSVAGIMSVFTKAITELDTLANAKAQEVMDIEVKIDDLGKAREAATDEQMKAESTAEKLKEILGE